MSSLNWAKLKDTGRAKDIGVAWDEAELKALHEYNIPADYVREGVLTKENYAKALEAEVKDGKKSLMKSSKEELLEEAISLGLKVTPDASKDALVKGITKSYEIKKSLAESEKNLAKAYKIEEKAQAKSAAAEEVAVEKAKDKLTKK